jgi:hypothetical protein
MASYLYLLDSCAYDQSKLKQINGCLVACGYARFFSFSSLMDSSVVSDAKKMRCIFSHISFVSGLFCCTLVSS